MQSISDINNTNNAVATSVQADTVVPKVKYKAVRTLDSVERFATTVKNGLTQEQVLMREQQGLSNADTSKKGKSNWQIVFGNIFTFFNMLYIAIAVILGIYQQWSNMSFLFVIVANTLIAIIQEIKSKKMLDKLNLVTVPTVSVLRDGTECIIECDHIVLDDIVYMSNGSGISCDSTVLSGSVEVNEAILTGEADAVLKNVGDQLFAGSYIVSGSCTARADKVGKFNYISSLTAKARKYQKPRSQMLRALRGILIAVSIVILPMIVLLWNSNYSYFSNSLTDTQDIFIQTLNKTSGSIISMIPAGPFLLTSVALAVSVIRLVRRKIMVQELYCIEMLARVNCLCLDKTGTITDGTMKVVESLDLRANSSDTVKEIMSAFVHSTKEDNYTAKALKKYFGANKGARFVPKIVLPFSSSRKLSAVSFEGKGTYILGAPEFVLSGKNERVADIANKYQQEGLRVLVLAHSATIMHTNKTLPAVRRAIAVIAIEDRIRPSAKETIGWFAKNGVDIRVISGDNAVTVSNIAKRVGIVGGENYISLEGMTKEEVQQCATQYTIFGRVSPEQKAILVKALRGAGLTVAMTGDGVNDILAMKESDCSISLAGGSDAARNVSHLVLMQDDFSALPEVVAEGRRVVNNICSASTLFFMKTIYIISINLIIVLSDLVLHLSVPSPYETIQIFLLETVVLGTSTTLLALQPNHRIIKGNFLRNVLSKCFPASISFLVMTLSVYAMDITGLVPMTGNELSTIVSIVYTFGGLYMLFYSCQPFNTWKKAMFVSLWAITIVSILALPELWKYSQLNITQTLLLLVEILALPVILYAIMYLAGQINQRNIESHQSINKGKRV